MGFPAISNKLRKSRYIVDSASPEIITASDTKNESTSQQPGMYQAPPPYSAELPSSDAHASSSHLPPGSSPAYRDDKEQIEEGEEHKRQASSQSQQRAEEDVKQKKRGSHAHGFFVIVEASLIGFLYLIAAVS